MVLTLEGGELMHDTGHKPKYDFLKTNLLFFILKLCFRCYVFRFLVPNPLVPKSAPGVSSAVFTNH